MTDRIILGPTRHPMPAAGKSRRIATLPGVGPLEIWVGQVGPATRAEPDLFVLKFPGTASRAEDPTEVLADWWPGLRIEVWSVNPPGYGGSGGRASLRRIPAMSHLALTTLLGAADGAPIVVLGESLGGVSALYLAARHSVDALLLRDPPPLRETIRARHPSGLLGRAAALLAKGHDDEAIRKALPKFDLPSPEPWMKEMAHADLNGVFLRAPMAVSFLVRRHELPPSNIPNEFASAGLLEMRNGSPHMTRFVHGKRTPHGRDGEAVDGT